MATDATRELTITYGSLTVGGGSTTRLLDGYHQFEIDFEVAAVEYTFVLAGYGSQAAFETDIAAVETAFRTPNQDLTVASNVGNILSLSHSANTGFNARPRIIKRDDVADTQLSRRYTVRIEFGMPADTGGRAGLREGSVEVVYSPARVRQVTIRVTYTAVGGSSALDQYQAEISGYATSVLSALNITQSELAEETFEYDDENKVIEAFRVYDELIFSQGGAAFDDSELVRQRFSVTRTKIGPGDTAGTVRLATLVARYEASIDKDLSVDIMGKYEAIRAWIVSQVETVLGGGAVALIDETVQPSFDGNQLSATLTFEGVVAGGFLEDAVTFEDFILFGLVLVPVWNGDPTARYDYQGPETRIRRITEVFTRLGTFTGNVFSDEPQGLSGQPKSVRQATTEKLKGIDGIEFLVTEVVRVTEREIYTPVRGGGGRTVAEGGGGAGGVGGAGGSTSGPGSSGGTGSGGSVTVGIGGTLGPGNTGIRVGSGRGSVGIGGRLGPGTAGIAITFPGRAP